jgi:Tfp pilus assembly protein PilE
MKSHSGISMIELVIVLIIIILIASFSVYTGSTAIDQANLTEVYTELLSIKSAVNDVNVKRSMAEEFDFDDYLGEIYDKKVGDMTKSEYENASGIIISDASFEALQNSYIIFGMDNMSFYQDSEVRKYYGLDSIKHSYVVNFDESRVDLLKTVKIGKQKVRTFEQVRALVDEGSV